MPTHSAHPPEAHHRLHAFLSRMPGLRRSFTAKVLAIAFLGIHVPLLVLVCYFLGGAEFFDPLVVRITLLALAATLVGTALTILALRALLQPIHSVSDMLLGYQRERRLPTTVPKLGDELGELARGTARALAELDEQLNRLACLDSVTGALNAHGLEAALTRHAESGTARAALAVLELRDFDNIEVALGREAGEFVARSIIDRLRLAFGDAVALVSMGRGRFGVLATGASSENLETGLEYATAAMKRPLEVNGRELRLHCVVGVSRSEGGAVSRDKLLVAAEGALLAAREQHASAWVDASESGERIRTRVELAIQLYHATTHELFAVYQPRVTAKSKQIVSLEALVRWNHPTRGVLSAGAFVPIAESSGQIIQIGEYMLDCAVAQAAAWAERGVGVSVNVAAHQLAERRLDAVVATSLARYGVAPGALELEITESALLIDLDGVLPQLRALCDLGVHLALDDFGIGYSSLSYLNRLPVHRLKIDGSFVSQLHVERTRQLVRGIVEIAHGLGLAVTAEGVEAHDQEEILCAMGCDELQGFLYARPVPAGEVPWARFGGGVEHSS
ncbi:MAG: EAL domain-containing protein [Nitrococcus sp.]|nr:EAL domain-containing protein [Nitrococcus sp.]